MTEPRRRRRSFRTSGDVLKETYVAIKVCAGEVLDLLVTDDESEARRVCAEEMSDLSLSNARAGVWRQTEFADGSVQVDKVWP